MLNPNPQTPELCLQGFSVYFQGWGLFTVQASGLLTVRGLPV